jgi:hypothetical protein
MVRRLRSDTDGIGTIVGTSCARPCCAAVLDRVIL